MYIMFLGAEVSMWLETSGIGTDLHNLGKKLNKRRQRKRRERGKRSPGRPTKKE